MVLIRPSMWLAVLQTLWVVSAVSTETHRNQRQEAVVDAQAAIDLVKPATHHQKKAKHAEAKITDVKAKANEAHEGATQKRKGPVKKKAAKPASLMRAEPATDPDSNAEEDKDEEEDKEESIETPDEEKEASQEASEEESKEGSKESSEEAESSAAEKAQSTGLDDSDDAGGQQSSEDTKSEDSASTESEDEDPGDGTDTEALKISEGGGRTVESSNATAAVLVSDTTASTLSGGSQANLSQSSSHATAEESDSNLEQGLAEASELDAQIAAGLDEGLETESEDLNRGAAQACIGTMIEKCPTDKSDPCKSSDAGTCVNVFHKCVNDKLTQCAVRKGKCATGGATCYLPCTGVELHGSSCAAQPVDNCNGGYVSDGTSGMSCMISTADITKCTNAGTCALPEKE